MLILPVAFKIEDYSRSLDSHFPKPNRVRLMNSLALNTTMGLQGKGDNANVSLSLDYLYRIFPSHLGRTCYLGSHLETLGIFDGSQFAPFPFQSTCHGTYT